MYKILIASDRTAVRNRVKGILQNHGLSFCGEARTLEQALNFCRTQDPNIVIFNFHSSLLTQLSIVSEIAKLGKSVNVLIYSSFRPGRSTRAFIRAGASGFLPEKSSLEELLTVLRGLIAGFTMVPIHTLKQPRIKLGHRPSAVFSRHLSNTSSSDPGVAGVDEPVAIPAAPKEEKQQSVLPLISFSEPASICASPIV